MSDLRTSLKEATQLRVTVETARTLLAEASVRCNIPIEGEADTWPMKAADEILRLREGSGLAALEAVTELVDRLELVHDVASAALMPWTARLIRTRGQVQTIRTVKGATLADLIAALA